MRHRILEEKPILIVEDDAVQGLDLAEMLREAGATVIGPVIGFEEALPPIRTKACAAAIIDFRLGQFNAVPIGHELHEQEIPFVIYTGYDCVGVLPRHWQGCRVIVKPAPVRELIWTVAALLRWRRMRARTATPHAGIRSGTG